MRLKEELILKFRRFQTIISVLLFFMILFFFVSVTDFKITEIQISKWGTLDDIGWIFNSSLVCISISIFINVFFYIKNNNRIFFKKLIFIIFFLVSLNLFLTGFFNVGLYPLIHNISAFAYFFLYPLAIFILAFLNRSNITYNEWLFHLVSSLLMIIPPLFLMTFFNGMAISEFFHTFIVMFWNISILHKTLN